MLFLLSQLKAAFKCAHGQIYNARVHVGTYPGFEDGMGFTQGGQFCVMYEGRRPDSVILLSIEGNLVQPQIFSAKVAL